MRYHVPVLSRLFNKFAFDILPAALASAIGGFLLTHYHLDRAAAPAQVGPASAEMMQLLRDEHGLIVNFLKAQIADQKERLTAEDGAPRVVADAAPGAAAAPPHQLVVAMAAAKPATPHGRPPVTSTALAPLVIAPAPQNESVRPAADASDSLLARTVGIKDNVVAVTHRVVSVIGGIPTWIGSIGDRMGGQGTNPRPTADLVSAS